MCLCARARDARFIISTSPQRTGKPICPIALICTTRCRTPASASTDQGPNKGELIPSRRCTRGRGCSLHLLQTSEGGTNRLFEIAWICTTCRRIPASASTNQGTEKGDLIPFRRCTHGRDAHFISFSPQKECKSSLSVTWICTTRRRIPASAGKNQGTDKGHLIPFRRCTRARGTRVS